MIRWLLNVKEGNQWQSTTMDPEGVLQQALVGCVEHTSTCQVAGSLLCQSSLNLWSHFSYQTSKGKHHFVWQYKDTIHGCLWQPPIRYTVPY